jgi:hydroxyethylthiazole kinase-like sugar kinase family protein
MKTLILSAVLALGAGCALPNAAHAAGCLKGAVVGGVAGHMAHHGVLGAVGGCAVGHHMAAKKAAQQRQP